MEEGDARKGEEQERRRRVTPGSRQVEVASGRCKMRHVSGDRGWVGAGSRVGQHRWPVAPHGLSREDAKEKGGAWG